MMVEIIYYKHQKFDRPLHANFRRPRAKNLQIILKKIN